MQLPYGTLSASYRGPRDLREVGEGLGKERLTGYLRVSAFEKGGVCEYVIVYAAGKSVMAFASVGATDRKDPDSRLMAAAIGKDNAIVEVCQLQDKQVKLLQDLYREFAVTPAPAASVTPAPAAPAPLVRAAPKEPVRETQREAPRAASGTTLRPEDRPRPAPAPEIRGRFVRAEEIGSPDEYLRQHPGETGHLLLMIQRDGRPEEEHVILIKGKIEAVYNAATSGPGLWHDIRASPGQAEFYAVDEALLTSIIGRYTRAASARPAEPQAIRPAAVVGIPARDLLEGPRRVTPPVWDDGGLGAGDADGGIEDDIAVVRKVEHDFAGHVDELLSKLELSHLRSRKKRV